MNLPAAPVLGAIYIVSELGLGWKKRAVAGAARVEDRGSLRLLWVVIIVSVTRPSISPISSPRPP